MSTSQLILTPGSTKMSRVVSRLRPAAERIAGNRTATQALLDTAARKLERSPAFAAWQGPAGAMPASPVGAIMYYMSAMLRLVQAVAAGRYSLPWGTLIACLAAILYYVLPVDLIPDRIPLIGFVDDLTVIGFALGQIKSDVDNFLAWEQTLGPAAA